MLSQPVGFSNLLQSTVTPSPEKTDKLSKALSTAPRPPPFFGFEKLKPSQLPSHSKERSHSSLTAFSKNTLNSSLAFSDSFKGGCECSEKGQKAGFLLALLLECLMFWNLVVANTYHLGYQLKLILNKTMFTSCRTQKIKHELFGQDHTIVAF